MTTIVEDVIDIIASKTSVGRDKILPATKLKDIDIASLDVVEIVFAIEEKFGIQIPFNANTSQIEFETVGEIVGAVEKLVAEQAP